MREKKKKKHSEVDDFFKEISFGVVVEILVSIVWNILMFIPRSLIRLFSSF